MKKRTVLLSAAALLAIALLAGCGARVNFVSMPENIRELMEENALTADPVEFNLKGVYRIVFHYDQGGFKKADLSKAFVAYYPYTLNDQIDTITGGETESIPPLPKDAADIMEGDKELEKIAIIEVETLDDKTLAVTFTDEDQPPRGRTYWFVIPNLNLAGSASTERTD